MRCGIDGLASVISDQYNLDLFSDAIFLFCGRKKDRYKALLLGSRWIYVIVQTDRKQASTMAKEPRGSQEVNVSGVALIIRRIIHSTT